MNIILNKFIIIINISLYQIYSTSVLTNTTHVGCAYFHQKALITRAEFDEFLLEHPLLLLPRISSHEMFDLACPVEKKSHDKKLVII